NHQLRAEAGMRGRRARQGGPAAPASVHPGRSRRTGALAGHPPLRQTNAAASLREHAYLARLRPEPRPVIDRTPGFGLPLMHHLVQHGVSDLVPRVLLDVQPADGYLDGAAAAEVDA